MMPDMNAMTARCCSICDFQLARKLFDKISIICILQYRMSCDYPYGIQIKDGGSMSKLYKLLDISSKSINHYHMLDGANVVTIKTPKSGLCFLQILVRVGHKHETSEEYEIAHLLEHLNGRFTSSMYPSGSANLALISDLGASMNASVDDNISEYHISGASCYHPMLWDLLFQSYVDYIPDTDDGTLQNEKNAVREELAALQSSPWIDFDEAVTQVLYPNTRLSVTVQQRLDNLPNITNEQLSKFRKDYYTSDRTTFIIAGDISKGSIKKMLSQIKAHCSKSVSNKCTNLYKRSSPCQSLRVSQKVLFSPNRNVGNYRVNLIFKNKVGAFTPRSIELDVLSDILTGGMAGTLFTELRTKRGIVYGVSSYSYTDVVDNQYSNFVIETNVSEQNVLEAVTAILQILELSKMSMKYYECSLPRTVNNIETSLKVSAAKTTPEMYSGQYANEVPWGGCVVSFKERIRRLEDSLHPSMLIEAARGTFKKECMLIGISGPKDISEPIIQLVHSGSCPLS